MQGNRRRVQGERGKRLQRQRGERIERNFAHQFDTGGLDRLYVRGLENVHKKFLMQAAACNLALLLRSRYGSGKPRAAHDRTAEVILMILAAIKPFKTFSCRSRRIVDHRTSVFVNHKAAGWFCRQPKIGRFRHGLLAEKTEYYRNIENNRSIWPRLDVQSTFQESKTEILVRMSTAERVHFGGARRARAAGCFPFERSLRCQPRGQICP